MQTSTKKSNKYSLNLRHPSFFTFLLSEIEIDAHLPRRPPQAQGTLLELNRSISGEEWLRNFLGNCSLCAPKTLGTGVCPSPWECLFLEGEPGVPFRQVS